MKICTRCKVPQATEEYETPRKRICNTCSELLEEAKRRRVPPPQKLSDEEFTANYLKTKAITRIPHSKTVYTEGENLVCTGDTVRTNHNGDRVYRFLGKNNSGTIDETSRNYGQ